MATESEPQKTVTTCPECKQRITLKGQVKLGRRLACAHCGAKLKVIKTDPLKLGLAYAA